MIIKIVGFKVGVDRSTCYYKIDVDYIRQITVTEEDFEMLVKDKLGNLMSLALKKSDFVSVRK